MEQQKIDGHLDSIRRELSILEAEMSFRSEELSILRWIDQQILDTSGSKVIESEFLTFELFQHTLKYINDRLLRHGVCGFYTNHDEFFQILDEDRSGREFPPSITCSASSINWKEVEKTSRYEKGDGSPFSNVFMDWDRIYVEPLFVFDDSLLGAFVVLERGVTKQESQLEDDDVIQTFRGIFAQLKVAYRFLVEYQRNLQIAQLWQVFAEQDLSPYVCFQILTAEIPNLMPQFGGHSFPDDVEIQILMKRSEPGQLRIRSSTGRERDTDIIFIDDSVSGLPFNNGGNFINVDPTTEDYADIYKSYFGDHERKIRTEVVLPLRFGEKIVGVINLESYHENAFKEIQIETLLQIAAQLSPVVMGLEARLAQNRGVQTAYGAIMSKYLNGFGKVLRHGISSPVSALLTNIETMERKLGREQPDLAGISRTVEKMKESYRSIHRTISDFTTDLSSYGAIEAMDLAELTEETIQIAEDTLKPTGVVQGADTLGDFAILFSPEVRPMVRASRLFKPYLLALIDNSIRSIEKKQKAGMLTEPGEISVSVEVDSWNPGRATFILRDNGDGVGEERLRELRRFKFGTRFRDDSGSGFGLAAAQRYVSTIDGWMELDSAAGEFFQVTISFQMEKPEGRR